MRLEAREQIGDVIKSRRIFFRAGRFVLKRTKHEWKLIGVYILIRNFAIDVGRQTAAKARFLFGGDAGFFKIGDSVGVDHGYGLNQENRE